MEGHNMFQLGKSDTVKITNLFPELIYTWDAKPIQIPMGLKQILQMILQFL